MRFRLARIRGTSLVEALISLAVLAVGLVGIMGLTISSANSNQRGRRWAQAAALASDLVENISTWNYTDGRLTPASGDTITSTSDTKVDNRAPQCASLTSAACLAWKSAAITNATYKPTFSEDAYVCTTGACRGVPPTGWTSNSNALTNAALYNSSASPAVQYDGVTTDVDGDSRPDYERYWSVFLMNDGTGAELGKLVLVSVRWHEASLGWRWLTMTTFVANPVTTSL